MSILFPRKPKPVVGANEFLFSAVGLAHGHIYGMTHALLNAGATLCEVWDDSPQKVAAFLKVFPQAKAAPSLDAALGNPAYTWIASAAVPSERCALGIRAMRAGKDYFVDKAPMTSLDHLAQARHAVAETGQKIHGLLLGTPSFRSRNSGGLSHQRRKNRACFAYGWFRTASSESAL